MQEQILIKILDKFILYAKKGRLLEAKRYVKQEIENIEGITEQRCKLKKLGKKYCNICKNQNCNLNSNSIFNNGKTTKSYRIDILQNIKESIFNNEIEESKSKINEYIKIIKDNTLLEIMNRLIIFLNRNELYEAKTYILIELNNFKDFTPAICKNTIYSTYDFFCKVCNNFNCSSNKNKPF